MFVNFSSYFLQSLRTNIWHTVCFNLINSTFGVVDAREAAVTLTTHENTDPLTGLLTGGPALHP